jgi:glutathione S-transferase
LEHNGKRVNQSVSICRYLGKLVKLAGKEFLVEITIVRLEKNVALKKTMKEEALKETVPFYLSRLDALVQKNNGFLALGRVRIFQNLDKGFES